MSNTLKNSRFYKDLSEKYPLFSYNNVEKLLNEFPEIENIVPSGNIVQALSCRVSSLFYNLMKKSCSFIYEWEELRITGELLNRRTLDKSIIPQILLSKHAKYDWPSVVDAYNKFIYWFETDKSLKI